MTLTLTLILTLTLTLTLTLALTLTLTLAQARATVAAAVARGDIEPVRHAGLEPQTSRQGPRQACYSHAWALPCTGHDRGDRGLFDGHHAIRAGRPPRRRDLRLDRHGGR